MPFDGIDGDDQWEHYSHTTRLALAEGDTLLFYLDGAYIHAIDAQGFYPVGTRIDFMRHRRTHVVKVISIQHPQRMQP